MTYALADPPAALSGNSGISGPTGPAAASGDATSTALSGADVVTTAASGPTGLADNAVTLTALGFQTVLASFFASLLEVRR